MSRGIVYVATGARFVEEACRSAASVRQFHPTWAITLFTDQPPDSPHFENIIRVPSGLQPQIVRLTCLANSPYDETFALDTDTFVCAPLDDLFDVLRQFDMAGTQEPFRRRPFDIRLVTPLMRPIPKSLVHLSPGALLYRNSPPVKQFLTDWQNLYAGQVAYARAQQLSDPVYQDLSEQISMLEAFFYSTLRWMPLQSEYNCVITMPGYLGEQARILHGHHPNPAYVAECLNQFSGPRVHTVSGYTLTVTQSNGTRRTYQTLGRAAILNEYRQDLQDTLTRRGIRRSLPYLQVRFNRWWTRSTAYWKSKLTKL